MKTIITCAITGAATKPDQTPHLPITPEEIAESGLEAAEAGASILHIHVRNPDTGRPSYRLSLYQEVVNLIKKRNKDVLINLTTGIGAQYMPSEELGKGGPGTILLSAEDRVKHIEIIKPDICSLDFNTMHQGNGGIRINHIPVLKEMATRIKNAGTKPEVELFDTGDFRIAKELYSEGLLGENPFWQFAMGIKYGWDCTPESLAFAKTLLPANATWSAFGIGKMEMPFVALTQILGGHVRVGLEDNIYLEKGILATNKELVQKAKRIINDLGGQVASFQESKNILNI
jgi:uncharacterized protein (DUF849 family)